MTFLRHIPKPTHPTNFLILMPQHCFLFPTLYKDKITLRKSWFDHCKSLATALHVGLFCNCTCNFDFVTFKLFTPLENWWLKHSIFIKSLKDFLYVGVYFWLDCIKGINKFFLFILARIDNRLQLFFEVEGLFALKINEFNEFWEVTFKCFWIGWLLIQNVCHVSHVDHAVGHLTDFIEVNLGLYFKIGEHLDDSRFFTGNRAQEWRPEFLDFVRVIQRVNGVKTIRTGIEFG